MSKTTSDIDQIAEDIAKKAKTMDLEDQLQIMDRLLKYEALKIKKKQGTMGSGFDDEGDE